MKLLCSWLLPLLAECSALRSGKQIRPAETIHNRNIYREYHRCVIYTEDAIAESESVHIPDQFTCTAKEKKAITLTGNVEKLFNYSYQSGNSALSIPLNLISDQNELNIDDTLVASAVIVEKDLDLSENSAAIDSETFKNLLVLRLSDASEGSFRYSAAEIGDHVFGMNGVSLKERYQSCSKDKVIFEPAKGLDVRNGVLDVSTPVTLETSKDCVEAGSSVVLSAIRNGTVETYDYLMIICPDSTDFGGAAATAYVNGRVSWYKDHYGSSPFIQAHEIGHNLNFRHSGGGNDEYGDPLSLMGAKYRNSPNWGKLCFDAAKSYFSGWYQNGNVDVMTGTYNNLISDVNSWYSGRATTQDISVRVSSKNTESYYFMLHRLEGITSDARLDFAQDYVNKVNIVRQEDSVALGQQSWHVASLGNGEKYSEENWGGTFQTLIIKVCHINEGSSSSPAEAKVLVYLEGQNIETCDETETSEPPTMAPNRRENDAYSLIPSSSPVNKSCEDSETKIPIGDNKRRGCKWVRKNDLCINEDYASHCPQTCGKCYSYRCSDSRISFLVNKKGKERQCSWIAKKESKRQKRCNKKGVRSTCRETCGYCSV